MAAEKLMIVLHFLPPFKAMVLAFLPKAIQATLAVLADFYTWRLAEKIYGQGSKSAWSTVRASLCLPMMT